MDPNSRCQTGSGLPPNDGCAAAQSQEGIRPARHSGASDYNVMVNALFNPVAPASSIWATRM